MPDPDTYVQQLEADKAALEARIADLQSEVRTINNLIYRRRSQGLAASEGAAVNLKNADRLFFEAMILEALNSSNRGLRTGEIHTHITKRGYELNYNTLRSYVTKMRDRGVIKKATTYSYYWLPA
ncbi:hypothetical protein HRQ87_02335 [Sulfitobacter sp. 1151]|uniref:Ribonuclease R winged-helix domain-containing protein n=2 Tax=Parasulfitobacter algicola TaxID=2614809 RepID=A0ABX2IL81_9RHOB|nr:hypothetical protein [Sulfitobacter algicola]